jgi:hypothetical protein
MGNLGSAKSFLTATGNLELGLFKHDFSKSPTYRREVLGSPVRLAAPHFGSIAI